MREALETTGLEVDVVMQIPDLSDVAAIYNKLCSHALGARQEEELLKDITRTLRAHVNCDAVIFRLMERHIQTRVVALLDETRVLPVDRVKETWTQQDAENWRALEHGTFCDDVKTSPFIKPTFRDYALKMGLKCGFMVPLIRDGDIYGQIVYAWRQPRTLSDESRRYLRKLTDVVALALTAYHINRKQEFDPLTGLLNRVGLWRRWEVVSKSPFGTVFFADVDRFKSVNDTLGHLEGDRFLQEVARILRNQSDARAIVGRFGGDEFVIAIPDLPPSQAQDTRADLERKIHQMAIDRGLATVGISFGMAHWPEDGKMLEALLDKADSSLYQARRQRMPRGRVIPLFRSIQNQGVEG